MSGPDRVRRDDPLSSLVRPLGVSTDVTVRQWLLYVSVVILLHPLRGYFKEVRYKLFFIGSSPKVNMDLFVLCLKDSSFWFTHNFPNFVTKSSCRLKREISCKPGQTSVITNNFDPSAPTMAVDHDPIFCRKRRRKSMVSDALSTKRLRLFDIFVS